MIGGGVDHGGMSDAKLRALMGGEVSPLVSARMGRIKGKDTGPEMIVRRLVHSLGFRFRLHRRDLPGAPDLVFPARRKVIFVHGCYWHRHSCAVGQRAVRTRSEFWQLKFHRNVVRDRSNQNALQRLGWAVLVVWECELRDLSALAEQVCNFLSTNHAASLAACDEAGAAIIAAQGAR